MPLDQHCHQRMSELWARFKQQWGTKGSMTLVVTLRAAEAIISEALSPRLAQSSWKRVGCEPGKPWQRDTLLVARASEIFSSVRGCTFEGPKAPALNVLKAISPKKVKRKRGQCLDTSMKNCWNCAVANEAFSAEQLNIVKRGWRSGWKGNPKLSLPDKATMSENQQALLNQVDDVFKLMQKSVKQRQDNLEAPKSNAVSAPSQAAASAAPASSAAPDVKEATKESDSDVEYDLDCPDGASAYICAHFAKGRRQEVEPVAAYFVACRLRPQVSKGKPLSFIFKKEVKNILNTKRAVRCGSVHGRPTVAIGMCENQLLRRSEKALSA